jgi:hypothetical protein
MLRGKLKKSEISNKYPNDEYQALRKKEQAKPKTVD